MRWQESEAEDCLLAGMQPPIADVQERTKHRNSAKQAHQRVERMAGDTAGIGPQLRAVATQRRVRPRRRRHRYQQDAELTRTLRRKVLVDVLRHALDQDGPPDPGPRVTLEARLYCGNRVHRPGWRRQRGQPASDESAEGDKRQADDDHPAMAVDDRAWSRSARAISCRVGSGYVLACHIGRLVAAPGPVKLIVSAHRVAVCTVRMRTRSRSAGRGSPPRSGGHGRGGKRASGYRLPGGGGPIAPTRSTTWLSVGTLTRYAHHPHTSS